MRCPNCNTVLQAGDSFCPVCGSAVEKKTGTRRCAYCGEETNPGAAFCPSCGTPLNAPSQRSARLKRSPDPSAREAEEKAALKARTTAFVQAAQEGDGDAFSELYRLYYQKVYALAKTTVRSDADAEDVVQATFIKVWDNLPRLANADAFSTWIQRITLNQSYSLMRKRHPDVSIDRDEDEADGAAPLQLESDLMLPEVYAERKDLQARLDRIIRELSAVQQQTVTLFYYDGLPVENIAWIMNCSVNTVKSRLFLARKSIKTEIEEQERRTGQPFFGIAGIGLIPFGKLFLAKVRADAMPDAAASWVLQNVMGHAANTGAALGGNAAGTAVSAAQRTAASAAKGAVKTGAGAAAKGTIKAGAGTAAKAAAAAVSKKIIVGAVAAVLGIGAVTGGTIATYKIVRGQQEDDPKASISAAETAPAHEDPYVIKEPDVTAAPATEIEPDVTATPEPVVTETPEPGLSETERAAYRAYIKVLEGNRAMIDAYTWQKNLIEEEASADERLSRPVALQDIDGDGLIELLYCAPDEPTFVGDCVRLYIVDWVDDAARTVYVDDDDHEFTHGEEDYVYYQLEDEPTLYQQYSGGDEDGTWYELYRYLRQPDGTFAIEKIGEWTEDRDIAYELMTTLAPSANNVSMTCGEAIAYLESLLNGNVAAQEPVPTEAYRAYRDWLIAHKAEIDAFVWQFGGWEDAFTWLSDDPDNWDEPGYYDLNRLEPGAKRPVPCAVALYDVAGDAAPELILLRGPASTRFDYNTFSRLTILTYRSGQLVTLYDDDWNRLESFEGSYEFRIIAGSGDHKLIAFWRDAITEYEESVYYVFTETADGLLERTKYLTYYHLGAMDEDEVDEDRWTYLGADVDEATYESLLKKLRAEETQLLIYSLEVPDEQLSAQSIAMTSDEMLAYLNAQIGG